MGHTDSAGAAYYLAYYFVPLRATACKSDFKCISRIELLIRNLLSGLEIYSTEGHIFYTLSQTIIIR